MRRWLTLLLVVLALVTTACASTPGGWSINFNLVNDGWWYPTVYYPPAGYWRDGYWRWTCYPYRPCHRIWVPGEWVPY